MPRPSATDTGRKAGAILLGVRVACRAAAILHVAAGSADPGTPFSLRMSPIQVLRELLAGPTSLGSSDNLIVWQIRLPRALACLLAGGLLGAVGSAFQALFRNPLADPFIVGVSSGAAVGGALSLALGFAGFAGGFGLMACSFLGGMGALAAASSLPIPALAQAKPKVVVIGGGPGGATVAKYVAKDGGIDVTLVEPLR